MVKSEGSHQGSKGSGGALYLLALVPGVCFFLLLYGLFHVPLPWNVSWPWVASLGIELGYDVDGLSAQFLLLITGIGTLVFVYAGGYLAGHPKGKRVFLLLLLFMLAMIGAVVSEHMLVVFLFWEWTSVLSFLMVGFDHEQEKSRKSAQQAMVVTGVGGLFLLAGMILLGEIGGTYSLPLLVERAPTFLKDERLKFALILIIIGAFTKSAQFPFHFWLPNAMAAPTPVSAYLHSATMVKLGIYLLARLDAAFSDLLFWEFSLVGMGSVTAVFAAIQTIHERDLKRILAWSTIATLGTLTMLIGLPGDGAALATSALFFAHALYKAPLFFVAGNLDHGAGSRQIDRLTGMRRYMPWTAVAALLAALSMAGLPLTFGFVAKNVIKLAKAEAGVLHVVSYATVFVNAVSVAVAAIAAVRIFWGKDTVPRKGHPHEANLPMLLPPLVLVSTGLSFGLNPVLVDPVLGASARAMAPGFDTALVRNSYDILPVLEATLGSFLLGLIIYFRWDWLHRVLGSAKEFEKLGPESWYWFLMNALPRLAARLTRFLQHGMLPRYLLTLVGTVALIVMTIFVADPPQWAWPQSGGLTVPVLGASLLIALGAAAAVLVKDHLVLLLVGGLVGYGSAVAFLFLGAPDVAFTQFVVETIFVVVVATLLLRLRRMGSRVRRAPQDPSLRIVPLFVSVVFSIALTVPLFLASGLPLDSALTDFYAAQSLPAGHGRNVVNIILVDFRALDTLGEIAVITFSLLAAVPLLSRIRRKRT